MNSAIRLPVSAAKALVLLGGFWVLAAPAFSFGTNPVRDREPASAVHLSETGETITLTNSHISATIRKRDGRIVDIRLPDGPNLVGNSDGRFIYFDGITSRDGERAYGGLANAQYKLVENSASKVHVRLIDPDAGGFSLEHNYIMQADTPGVYVYLVWRHGVGQPRASLGHARIVIRGDPALFDRIYSTENKHGPVITASQLQGASLVGDEMYRLSHENTYAGPMGTTSDQLPVYTKYDWADYREHQGVQGMTGDDIGLWLITGSREYANGGPSKATNLSHYGPITLMPYQSGHFLEGGVSVSVEQDEEFEKVIGPVLIYVNQEAGWENLRSDAIARGEQEKDAWPYLWMNDDESLYPVERGSVTGVIDVTDFGPGANAILVLAAPHRDWQLQSKGYVFHTRADDEGAFALSKVRPGSYTLYGSVSGVTGEFRIDDVEVEANQTRNLGKIQWRPPQRENRLWRLGTPDRSTRGFRFADHPRQFGLWWRYHEERGTDPLSFLIGASDPATDWYYAQCALPLEGGVYSRPQWNIEFDLEDVPDGPALLTIALAGAIRSAFHVAVNQVDQTGPSGLQTNNDAGIYRSAVLSAQQRVHHIEFDSSLLRHGRNVVSITVRRLGQATWSGQLPELPGAGIMYDFVQLETGPVFAEQLQWSSP